MDLSLSRCKRQQWADHCGEPLHGRPGDACLEDVPLQAQDVAQVHRWCLCHQASWRSPPGDLPLAPQRTKPLQSIHNGKEVGRQDRLPWYPDGEERNYSPDLCLLEEDTHWQVPELQLTSPCHARYSEESCSAWRSGQRRYVTGVSDGMRYNTSDKCSGPIAIPWPCSKEEPESTPTNTTVAKHPQAPILSLCQRFQWTNWEDVPTGVMKSARSGLHFMPGRTSTRSTGKPLQSGKRKEAIAGKGPYRPYTSNNSFGPQIWTVQCTSTPLGSPCCSSLLPPASLE